MFSAFLKAGLIESHLQPVCYLQKFSFAAFVFVELSLWEAQQLRKQDKSVSETDEVWNQVFLLHFPNE